MYKSANSLPTDGKLLTNFNFWSICFCYVTGSGFEFGAVGKVNFKYISYESLKIDKTLLYKDYIAMIND